MSDPLVDAWEAIAAGVVMALRKRAVLQRQRAAEGTSTAGEKFPSVLLRTPEAACASMLAADWDAIADELEGTPI
jgi:hypothetical protein